MCFFGGGKNEFEETKCQWMFCRYFCQMSVHKAPPFSLSVRTGLGNKLASLIVCMKKAKLVQSLDSLRRLFTLSRCQSDHLINARAQSVLHVTPKTRIKHVHLSERPSVCSRPCRVPSRLHNTMNQRHSVIQVFNKFLARYENPRTL